MALPLVGRNNYIDMRSDMRFACSQKGMSLLGWLVVLDVVASFANAAFKITPYYMDYYSLEKVTTSVEISKVAEVRSVPEFYNYVGKGTQINGIRNLDLERALEVQLEDNRSRAHLKYEKHKPLIGNIDLVVHFDKEFRVYMP